MQKQKTNKMKKVILMLIGMSILAKIEDKLEKTGKETFTLDDLKLTGTEVVDEFVSSFTEFEKTKQGDPSTQSEEGA